MTRIPAQTAQPTVLLLAGHWLGAWSWDAITPTLQELSVEPLTLTLPGLDPDDPDRLTRALEDQARAITLESPDRPARVVAHSGANSPVSLVLDRSPHLGSHVVWLDSGPMPSGMAFAADLPTGILELPLPSWEELGAQASLRGLHPEQLSTFRGQAVPQPAGMLRERVLLSNPARWAVPTTFVSRSSPDRGPGRGHCCFPGRPGCSSSCPLRCSSPRHIVLRRGAGSAG